VPPPVVRRRVPPPPGGRIRLFIDGGGQLTESTFQDKQTFQQYLETGSFEFKQAIPRRPLVDGGFAVHTWRKLYVGGTVSAMNEQSNGALKAEVPNPVLFNRPRTMTADVRASRYEIAAHIQASWTTRATRNIELTAFGGPSIFFTQQTYVTALTVGLENETYPFDDFLFAGASTDIFDDQILGYNVGADVNWKFARQIGLGGVVRFSRGRKDFTPKDGVPFTVEVGGLHVGAGLRFIF
jgi:opacity protein-like surface antigen